MKTARKCCWMRRDDMAKCFCHEIDHLDGILFIDKVTEFLGEDEE